MLTAFIKKIMRLISKIIALLLIFTINFIRPLLGPSNICPFTIGCTQYALLALQEQPLHIAIKNILQRLVQCHPFGRRD